MTTNQIVFADKRTRKLSKISGVAQWLSICPSFDRLKVNSKDIKVGGLHFESLLVALV